MPVERPHGYKAKDLVVTSFIATIFLFSVRSDEFGTKQGPHVDEN